VCGRGLGSPSEPLGEDKDGGRSDGGSGWAEIALGPTSPPAVGDAVGGGAWPCVGEVVPCRGPGVRVETVRGDGAMG